LSSSGRGSWRTRFQEGEEPAKDAAALLAETGTVLNELEDLIRRINRANAATHIGPGDHRRGCPAARAACPALGCDRRSRRPPAGTRAWDRVTALAILNIQRLNYLRTIRHSSARIAGNLIT
jgi:hypothetical protein